MRAASTAAANAMVTSRTKFAALLAAGGGRPYVKSDVTEDFWLLLLPFVREGCR
jgi:hypothetical protein